jgi:hypothetical protein
MQCEASALLQRGGQSVLLCVRCGMCAQAYLSSQSVVFTARGGGGEVVVAD